MCLAGSEWHQMPLLEFSVSLQKQTKQAVGSLHSGPVYAPPLTLRQLGSLKGHWKDDESNCSWSLGDSRLIGGVSHRLRANRALFLPLSPPWVGKCPLQALMRVLGDEGSG